MKKSAVEIGVSGSLCASTNSSSVTRNSNAARPKDCSRLETDGDEQAVEKHNDPQRNQQTHVESFTRCFGFDLFSFDRKGIFYQFERIALQPQNAYGWKRYPLEDRHHERIHVANLQPA